jgi:hypothetical protein
MPTTTTTWDGILTYAHQDLAFVRRLHAALIEQGARVWVDWQLDTSSDRDKEESVALEAASALLYVISPDAVVSERCQRQLRRALQSSIRILPIYHRKVDSYAMPEGLGRHQAIDFRDEADFEHSVNGLLRAIRSIFQVGTEPPSEETLEARRTAGSGDRSNAQNVAIQLLRDGQNRPDQVFVTPVLANLLARAARINRRYEDMFDLSFSALLIAFLASDDALSQWFARYTQECGIDMEALLRRCNLDSNALQRIASEPPSREKRQEPYMITASASNFFRAAKDYRRRVARISDAWLDARHLMAVYIYRPVGHADDLVSLRYDRLNWSNAFLNWIQQEHPEELVEWLAIHREAFPSQEPEFPIGSDLLSRNGPSTHIATDIWTLNDALGYGAYAYALSRFMTHPETKPPLTISIQAPWGGGKTSLMRMIQNELDPEAFAEVKDETRQPRGKFTIGQTLGEIDTWIEEEMEKELPQVPEDVKRRLLTVWFNAWKYKSVSQVWAGLADAIIHQVAARLPLVDRERFWLRLKLKRVDADLVRHRIYERVIRYWWRATRLLVFGLGGIFLASIATALIGSLTGTQAAAWIGWAGSGLSVAFAAIVAVANYFKEKAKVHEEPAAISLGEYLQAPDYRAELGFLHQVEADLQRVFASIPPRYWPLVVFIDDLDRCSPAKVSQVVEAINLFLAGDFPNCIFVLGIDTEMVAAALQATHKEMIAQLPSDAGSPVGWRFMDKFVQLPFLIPPAPETDLGRYTKSLLSLERRDLDGSKVTTVASEAAERIDSIDIVTHEVQQLQRQHRLSDREAAQLSQQLEARIARRKLDEDIERFTDENPEVQNVLQAAASYFFDQGNPRELKRFVNTFRFHYFLWSVRNSRGLEVPTLDQLLRWTILTMRWPEVVRWLRRGGGSELQPTSVEQTRGSTLPTLTTRLRLIEEISGSATDLVAWQEQAKKVLRLVPSDAPWLNDDDLLLFFHKEYTQQPEGTRLSDGIGKGLW